MAGTMTFPALLPAFFAQWGIGNVEAGWINGVFHGGYVAAVPVLVTLTDRPRSPADIPVFDSHQRAGPAGLRLLRRWAMERVAVPGDRRSGVGGNADARPPHPVGQYRRTAPGPLSLLLHRLLCAGFQHLGPARWSGRGSDGLARRLRGVRRSHGRGARPVVVGHPQGGSGAGGAAAGSPRLPPGAVQSAGHGLYPGLFSPLLRVVRPARLAGHLPGLRVTLSTMEQCPTAAFRPW